MQDYSDNELDPIIARSLRSGTRLQEAQKRQAWEQVRARAAQQTMLPPLEPVNSAVNSAAKPAVHGLWTRRLESAARSAGRWMLELFFDDTPYDRAFRQYRPMYHMGVFDSYLRNAQGGLAT